MRYIPQSHNACLAYALLQIGHIPKRAVVDYERRLMETGFNTHARMFTDWLDKWCPAYDEAARRSNPFATLWSLPIGAGVAVVELTDDTGWLQHHAVSFEDGRLMDPASDGPGIPETIKQLSYRYKRDDGIDVRLIFAVTLGRTNESEPAQDSMLAV